MDGAVILLPIAPSTNGFSKSHIHEFSSHDHWYNPKENIINDDAWKSDIKLAFHHRSPPPPAAAVVQNTLPQVPPPTTSLLLPVQPPPVTAIDTSVPPPPLVSPPSLPPTSIIHHVEHHHQHLSRGETLNLKTSVMKQQTHQGVNTGYERAYEKTSSNAEVNEEYGKENQLAAPDLESMDEIWHGEFSKVFAPYLPHIWYLSPTDMCPSPRWRRFKDSAKVRFCCQTCGHGWTSMKGRVVFWYFLHLPFCEGYVQFKLYGQQCMRCNNGIFEPAMWYPEEVNKVLCNLYNRIGQTYYGFVKPPIRYDRRAGKPRTQHNATLCQACRDGECDSRPRTGPATPGPPHGVVAPTPTKIPPPTVAPRT